MTLRELLDYIDFDYEVTDVNKTILGTSDYELIVRRNALGYPKNGSEDDSSLAGPMVALIDKQDAYLGDIDSDRFTLGENLVSNIIERTNIYWNDYLRDPIEEDCNKIFDNFEDMYEYLSNLKDKDQYPLAIIKAILHPETVEVDDVIFAR